MANQEEQIARWRDVVEGTAKRNLSDATSNVKVYGDQLYSYGRHFELARRLPDGMYLLNGDGSTSSTSRQQAKVRNVMEGGSFWWWDEKARTSRWDRHEARDHVIIPHSALYSAGIDIDTIKVIDKRDSAPLETTIERINLPSSVSAMAASHGSWEREWARRWMQNNRAHRTPEGSWRWTEEVHRLGECIFEADVTWRDQRRTATFISAWDNQDIRTYFLSELPHPVVSLNQAYDALKPQTVKLGELESKHIVRQGDIFGVETEFTSHQLADMLKPEGMLPGARHSIKEHIRKMDYLLGTNHVATESVVLPNGAVLARGLLWHKPEGRRPDHVRQRLGKKWHVIVRNTVPVIAQRGEVAA